MRRVTLYSCLLVVGTLLVPPGSLQAQGTNAEVSALLTEVSLDSLIRYVSELSGEIPVHVADSTLLIYLDSLGSVDSVWVSDTLVSLPNRFHGANEAAAAFLEQKLRSFGYDSISAVIYPALPVTRNVVAYKAGTDPLGPLWVLCAHYDSVLRAPGADDNASGTAVVLEAARLLSNIQTNASIMFGFWDSEEAGLFGSDQFAAYAHDWVLPIDGVLNLDMVGWDGDGDRVLQIHADDPAAWIAGYMKRVAGDYSLGMNPYLAIPGTGRSDHMSFRKYGYPAVKIIEDEGDDFNPFYHTEADVIDHFDLEYFHEVAKLAVATVAELALSGTAVAAEFETPVDDDFVLDPVYPNPARDFVEFRHRAKRPDDVRFTITDVLGRTVAVLGDDAGKPGMQVIRWTIPTDLPAGLYFVTLQSDAMTTTRAFVIAR